MRLGFALLFLFKTVGAQGQQCIDPDGVAGVCKNIRECPRIRNTLVQQKSNEAYIEYVKQSNAACDYVRPFVCCEPTSAPIARPTCGAAPKTQNRVVGGDAASLGSWPWIALLGYNDSLGGITFKCGGSLISTRHILTAAQCNRKNMALVRLGEHDTSTSSETQHVDAQVLKVVAHPNYDPKDGNNDLAIVYLTEDVTFTDLIRPICLAPIDLTNRLRRPYIAGWGYTQEGGQAASMLQELEVTVYNNSVCVENYRAAGKLLTPKEFDESIVMCAGSLDGTKDACKGDGGGPLMVSAAGVYYQIGVVSHGVGCARTNLPGAYTRVQAYTGWIKARMEEIN